MVDDWRRVDPFADRQGQFLGRLLPDVFSGSGQTNACPSRRGEQRIGDLGWVDAVHAPNRTNEERFGKGWFTRATVAGIRREAGRHGVLKALAGTAIAGVVVRGGSIAMTPSGRHAVPHGANRAGIALGMRRARLPQPGEN